MNTPVGKDFLKVASSWQKYSGTTHAATSAMSYPLRPMLRCGTIYNDMKLRDSFGPGNFVSKTIKAKAR